MEIQDVILLVLLVAALAAFIGWRIGKRSTTERSAAGQEVASKVYELVRRLEGGDPLRWQIHLRARGSSLEKSNAALAKVSSVKIRILADLFTAVRTGNWQWAEQLLAEGNRMLDEAYREQQNL